MLKVKVTDTHDWIRLALTEGVKPDEKKISLTWSRYRDSASGRGLGDGVLKEAALKLASIRNATKSPKTLGSEMSRLAKIAEKCSTISEFVKKMK